MFKEIQNTKKILPEGSVKEILQAGEEGVLATIGEDGYPYATPLNYVYHNGAIYFHCALTGHKLDNIAFNPNVSFCVYVDTELLPSKFSIKFKSVIAFGKAEKVSGDEKKEALLALIHRLSPDHIPAGEKYIKNDADKAVVIKINIEHATAKGRTN
ncbi:pyridoxamine 5'-phosphate oxidase family protein [Desulfovibrio sp. JC022]|uniref:pyridoxamine 5'-phosphate oxidase family protein n=1 Tax=Desulfovibrio sp. JC022 TaxID=2593642 RepID=UPI0013D4EF7E|nr:pyridoxamine 5'-phosphate oxidase family protein [Desulfovibrio sp. JC022]NDV22656.1 pyridoxamine 5'-phosphate oxidase family protein [Desulfovibrio sp. JC022]